MKLKHEFNKSEAEFILKLISFIKDNDISKNNLISVNGYTEEFLYKIMTKSIIINNDNGDIIKLSIIISVGCKNNSSVVEINYKLLEYIDFVKKELSSN